MADERNPDWITSELRHAATTERAPAHLRARIEDLQRQPAARRTRRAPARRLRVAVPALALALAAIVAVAVILALPGGPGAPSVAQAAELGAKAPTRAAPAVDPAHPGEYLTAKVGSLRFPDWGRAGGWRATGERVDTLGKRTVITIYYRRGAQTVAYSIAAMPLLAGQEPGYRTFTQNGRQVVSWQEGGHSCVLSGAHVSARELTGLAQTAVAAQA